MHRDIKSQSKPIQRGEVALNLDRDMKKFKNYTAFNKEFQKRLLRKERQNTINFKKQKDEDFKYPNIMWKRI